MRRRRLLLIAVCLLGIGGILFIVAHIYLRSERVRLETIARLEAIYGGPVRLERVEIGSTGTTLYGLQLLEAEANPGDPPWLTVRRVDVDVTALDLLLDAATPQEITLTGAAVTLRFDRSGRMLTRFPRSHQGTGAIPRIHLRDSQLTLRQEGRPDMVVAGIGAELHADGDRLVFTSTVTDAYWGGWDLNGHVERSTGASEVHLKTAQAQVTQERLAALPFIPPRVWEQVQAEGDTRVEVVLRFASGLHYRVELAPRPARVHVPSIDLTAEQVNGRVIIEDGLVQLLGLQGRTADGDIETSGDLDFRSAPARLDLAIAVVHADLRRLPNAWGLPEQLEGRLTGQADLQIVLRTGGVDVTGEGQGVIDDASIAGLPARPIDLRLHTEAGKSSGLLEATLALEDADLTKLARNPGSDSALPLAGRLSLQAQLVIPLDTPSDRRTYRGSGTMKCNRLLIDGRPIEKVEAALRVERGALLATGLSGLLEGMPLAGAAEAELAVPHRYRVRLDLRHGDLAMLHRLLPELRPELDIEGMITLTADLRGTLKPFTFTARGTGRASPLKLEDMKLDHIDFHWVSDAQTLNFSEMAASFYGGRLSGTLSVPLKSNGVGTASLRFEELDLGALDEDVRGLPFELEGRASGNLEGKLTAARPGQPPEYSAQIEVRAPKLRVQELPAEDLRATIHYRKSAVDYSCEGRTLGGRFMLAGQLPSRETENQSKPEGRLRMESIELARLWPLLGVRDALEHLAGSIDLEFVFLHAGQRGQPTGGGRLVLNRLRWDDTELASSLYGDIVLDPHELRLRNVTAALGEGLFNGQVCLDLRQLERSWFNLDLQHVEVSRLLAPWLEWASRFQGPVDLRLRGTLGREWSGAGRLSLMRGKVHGIEVADLQAPIDFVFSPRFGQGQVHLREIGAQAAQGRVTGRTSVSWGSSLRLDGQMRFFSVDLRTFLRDALDLGQVGGGRMSGRIDFGANDLRSPDDLTASVEASFAQSQALDFPVLRQLIPYLMPGQTSSPVFQSGDLRAHLSRGVIRVQRLALTGTLLQILLEGTITLQGRIDLSVTANTGRTDTGGYRLPAGPLPLGIVRQASSFLANRLVRLRLQGTTRNPVIQVEPLPVLTEEALRFFLVRP